MVKHMVKKTGIIRPRFLKGFVWALSVIFAFILLLQLTVIMGIFWLSSLDGQAFIQKQISNALKDTEYTTIITPVSYSFPSGFKFGMISVADTNGVFAEVHNAVVRPDFIKMGVRVGSLSVSINADNVIIHRLPKNNMPTKLSSIESFVLPDLYFTRLVLNSLNVKKLDIHENVFGTAMVLSPRLNTVITLGDTVRVDLNLVNKSTRQKDRVYVTASGIMYTDNMEINIIGRIATPLLDTYTLGDIDFTVLANSNGTFPQGKFHTRTSYKGHRVDLATDFAIENNMFILSAIRGNAPDLVTQGYINVNLDTMIAEGKVNVALSNIGTYSTKANLAGRMETNIILHNKSDVQNVMIESNMTDIRHEDIAIPSANIKINTEDSNHYGVSLSMNGTTIPDLRLDGTVNIRNVQAEQLTVDNINMILSLAQEKITITGKINPDSLDIALRTRGFNLNNLSAFLPEQISHLLVDADATVSGSIASPVIVTDMTVSPRNILKQAGIQLRLNGHYDNKLVRIDMMGQDNGIRTMSGYVEWPFELSLAPFIFNLSETTRINGRFDINTRSEKLAAFFFPVDHKLGGDLKINGVITNTIGNPDISGTARLTHGTYRFDPYVALSNITINTTLTSDSLRIEHSTASDGQKGQLKVNGTVNFKNQKNTYIDIILDGFSRFGRNKTKGILSANLKLQGRSDDYLLSGNVILGSFHIAIPERFQSHIPALNVIKKKPEKTAAVEFLQEVMLDIGIIADNHIFVRGWGLDAEFGGKINVNGTLDDPKLNGALSAKRGRYEEFGQRFELERAHLRFQGNVPPSPYLDIVATTTTGNINVTTALSGELSKPSIKLSSRPTLPEDEILSHILFGKNLEHITLFQAVQLKQTLDRFTGRGGGFDAIGILRHLTKLDDIRIDMDEEGEASVGIGKYLSDKVYLELEKGTGKEDGAARIQVELTPQINLESKIGQDTQAGAGIMWRWDH